MSQARALEERLTRQERQLRTLETQVGILIQGMNELSLRQKTARETMDQLASSREVTPRISPHLARISPREPTPRLSPYSTPRSVAALGPDARLLEGRPDADARLLEGRVAALEAEMRALGERRGRHDDPSDSPSLPTTPRGDTPSDGHDFRHKRDQHDGHHDHHQHGANKYAAEDDHHPRDEHGRHHQHGTNNHTAEEEAETDSMVPLGVLTSHRLDAGDMYEMSESVWDSCLFLGISPLGSPVSVLMAAMFVLNIVVQATFVMIVWNFMMEPEVSTDTLEGLLRFRVGLAHSVEYADTVLQRSMAAQICDEEDKLHMSAVQRTLYSDSVDFSSGGPLLSLLAQLCWLGSMIKEVNAAYSFSRSVLQIPRGGVTQVITADSSTDEVAHRPSQLIKESTHALSGSLVALTVVTRITQVSRARLVWAVFGITLPRILLASSVGFCGVQFLATSAEMSDLVLNAIALAFIIEMDELLYTLFAPRRLHTLMNNIEPLPMPPLRRCVPGLNCLLKMLFVGAGVFLIDLLLLRPVFWRLAQAQDILCSGETDFVYATNPATGMVHVTKTAEPQGWSQLEKTLLQVARPELEAKYGFDPGQDLLDLAVSDFSMAVVTQTGMGPSYGGVTLEASQFEPGYFEALRNIGSWTVGEMALVLPCSDREAGDSYDQVDWFLEQVTGIPGFTCSDLSVVVSEETQTFLEPSELCSSQAMVNLRALCPEACGCQLGTEGMTGMFNTVDYGCPQACHEFQSIINQWTYFTLTPQGVCQDASDAELIGDPSASLACLGNFSQCLELSGGFRRFYATYVKAIIPYMYGVWGATDRLMKMAVGLNAVGLLPFDSLENYLTRFWANLPVALLDGTWTLADPQAPHPRGLTGCRFLASYEVSALLGFDLCNPSTVTSIRMACPVSCGCRLGMTECPAACTEVDYGDSANASSTTVTVTTTESVTVTTTTTVTVTTTESVTVTTTT